MLRQKEALRIAEVIGMKLGHHVHGRSRDPLSNPVQHWVRATLDVIRHYKVADGEILTPIV